MLRLSETSSISDLMGDGYAKRGAEVVGAFVGAKGKACSGEVPLDLVEYYCIGFQRRIYIDL